MTSTRATWRPGAAARAALLWQLETGATFDAYPALTDDDGLVIGISDGRPLLVLDR